MSEPSWLTNTFPQHCDHITMMQKDEEIRGPSCCRGSFASFSAKINTNSHLPASSLVPFSCLSAFCTQWSQGSSGHLALVKYFSFATGHNFTHLCALELKYIQKIYYKFSNICCLIQGWIKYHIIYFNIRKLQIVAHPPKNSVSARQRDRHLNRKTNT